VNFRAEANSQSMNIDCLTDDEDSNFKSDNDNENENENENEDRDEEVEEVKRKYITRFSLRNLQKETEGNGEELAMGQESATDDDDEDFCARFSDSDGSEDAYEPGGTKTSEEEEEYEEEEDG
jgi:hypothetical protein